MARKRRNRWPGRESVTRIGQDWPIRVSSGQDAGRVERRERDDGRAVAAGRAAGRVVPRRLLPQQPAVPVRLGHRAARGRRRAGPGAGEVRVAGHRPIVLPVHEHDGRRQDGALGPVRGRLSGRRRGRDTRRPARAADRRRRARRDARARPVRLRSLFVLLAGHGEH